MVDLTLDQPVEHKKQQMSVRFISAGSLTLVLIVAVVTIAQYWMTRCAALDSVSAVLVEHLRAEFNLLDEYARLELSVRQDNNLTQGNNELEQANSGQRGVQPRSNLFDSSVAKVGTQLLELHRLKDLMLVSTNQKIVWRSDTAPTSFEPDEKPMMIDLLSRAYEFHATDFDFKDWRIWVRAFKNDANVVPVWTTITDDRGGVQYLVRMSVDFTAPFAEARDLAFQIMLLVTAGCILLFLVLSMSFRRGVNTIEMQERRLNHQISRLSNLLAMNKDMQRSMKTASARAVELNEQFLRRVGADLHDGPAQMIGYSVLRLNQVSDREEAKALGHEFHAVKEALEESLEEIRGISSGLVLPELAQMNLEQCLRKVVLLHSTKSQAEVAQYYSELPEDIPLPIKITAYRFVQEGLNNSERHGQAAKCRLNAHVIDHVLTVSLKDNGIGFRKSKLQSAAEGGHLGIMGLKDRIESLGGKLSINSELGVGTALKFTISLDEES